MERPEIVCPAGTPAALKTAIEAGADPVHVGFRDATSARNFPGLNFSRDQLADALDLTHARGARVDLAVDTCPRAGAPEAWWRAVDDGTALGVDALIMADPGLAV